MYIYMGAPIIMVVYPHITPTAPPSSVYLTGVKRYFGRFNR